MCLRIAQINFGESIYLSNSNPNSNHVASFGHIAKSVKLTGVVEIASKEYYKWTAKAGDLFCSFLPL